MACSLCATHTKAVVLQMQMQMQMLPTAKSDRASKRGILVKRKKGSSRRDGKLMNTVHDRANFRNLRRLLELPLVVTFQRVDAKVEFGDKVGRKSGSGAESFPENIRYGIP